MESRTKKVNEKRKQYWVYNADYTFTVGDERFEDTVTLMKKITVGDSIKVYYNPDAPKEYMTNAGRITTKKLVLILAFVTAGGSLIICGIVKKRRLKNKI